MRASVKIVMSFFILVMSNNVVKAQCASATNIYSFTYNSTIYEVVKENKTWVNAAACAVERGGILVEITDLAEQNAVFTEVNTNAGITVGNTVAPDGGGGAYVWMGGNDRVIEGNWVWDGNNDNVGLPFWLGTSTGNPVLGRYSNWGNEPDDFGGQDALGMSLDGWPLGVAAEWNDVDETNTLYFVIEMPSTLGINNFENNNDIRFFPNPAQDAITIENGTFTVNEIVIINAIGETVKVIDSNNSTSKTIDISELNKGIYNVRLTDKDGETIIKQFVK